MRFHNLPPELLDHVAVRKAEVAGFARLKDADEIADRLRRLCVDNPGYEVYMFASSMYFVVLITTDSVEDTDVTHTNP